MDHQATVHACVGQLLGPPIDDELSVLFYDLTTICTAGPSEQPGDVRRPGLSKDGNSARQFMLGVVQTADGLPIHYEILAGNTAEAPTLAPMLKSVPALGSSESSGALGPPSHSQQVPDQPGKQAEHHRAGQRHVPVAPGQAEAEVARQPAQADFQQPAAQAVEDHDGEQEDEQPAHQVVTACGSGRRR